MDIPARVRPAVGGDLILTGKCMQYFLQDPYFKGLIEQGIFVLFTFGPHAIILRGKGEGCSLELARQITDEMERIRRESIGL